MYTVVTGTSASEFSNCYLIGNYDELDQATDKVYSIINDTNSMFDYEDMYRRAEVINNLGELYVWFTSTNRDMYESFYASSGVDYIKIVDNRVENVDLQLPDDVFNSDRLNMSIEEMRDYVRSN